MLDCLLRWSGALCLVLLLSGVAHAQITPPGLGNAQTAVWQALGMRQSLDARDRRESMTYVGTGFTSGRHDIDPYARPDIFVLNQEFYDHFLEHWMYSVGLSYRRQDEYESEGREWKFERFQELRLYGRWSFVLSGKRTKFVNTFRPELRGFVQPDFGAAASPVQFRFREKTQLTVDLDARGHHRLIGAAELLESVARERADGWSDLAYHESRFSIFYSYRDEHLPFVIDVGYMNNLLNRRRPLVDVHYVSIDLVWTNPFGKPKQNSKPETYLQ